MLRRTNATHQNILQGAQYIGEVARYLFATPENEFEKKHKLRLMFGNGMRPQVWQRFQDRLRLSRIMIVVMLMMTGSEYPRSASTTGPPRETAAFLT